MIDKQTVLILGAGASRDYGYPLGNDLKHKVAKVFRSDFPAYLKKANPERLIREEWLLEFAKHLEADGASTIDRFISKSSTDDQTLARVGIVKTILEHEDETAMESSQGWYNSLYNVIDNYHDLSQIGSNKLSIITFNYDRSLEHYLFRRMEGNYGSSRRKEILDVLRKIPIIHMHGRVNPLPWESNSDVLPYGAKNYSPRIFEYAEKIGTPGAVDEAARATARTLFQNAKVVYFLGFGYDMLNLQGLGIQSIAVCPHIYGTSFGLEVARQHLIRDEFRKIGRAISFLPSNIDAHDFMMHQFNPNQF